MGRGWQERAMPISRWRMEPDGGGDWAMVGRVVDGQRRMGSATGYHEGTVLPEI